MYRQIDTYSNVYTVTLTNSKLEHIDTAHAANPIKCVRGSTKLRAAAFASVTVILTQWPWNQNVTYILKMYTATPKIKLLCQQIQKL